MGKSSNGNHRAKGKSKQGVTWKYGWFGREGGRPMVQGDRRATDMM